MCFRVIYSITKTHLEGFEMKAFEKTLKQLEEIAREQLFIETLETRNSDSLDFHEVSVWGVKEALRLAFELGKAEGQKKNK